MSMRGRVGVAGFAVALGVVSLAGTVAADPPHHLMPRPRLTVSQLPVHHFLPTRNIVDPVNPKHMAALKARALTKCGAREVAPNVWVKIDCHPYQPIANAKPLVFTQTRLHLMSEGQLKQDSAAAPVGADGSMPSGVDHRQNGTEGPIKNQEYTS